MSSMFQCWTLQTVEKGRRAIDLVSTMREVHRWAFGDIRNAGGRMWELRPLILAMSGGGGKRWSFDLGHVIVQSQFLSVGDGRGRCRAYRDVVLDQIYVPSTREHWS